MAARTNGRFVALASPGDIVSILDATSFSFVDRVKIVNRTTDEETDYVTTGIDGSFYGEIPLTEGENEIDLVAILYGGKEHTEKLRVNFDPVPRQQRMAEELDAIREENAALIEEIKEKLRQQLRGEIEAARQAARAPNQGREIEISVRAK